MVSQLRIGKVAKGRFTALGIGVAAVLALSACGGSDNADSGSDLSGTILIDGSSTVAPLATLAAEDFQTKNSGVKVTVGTSGTGGGFEKFCVGETDISDASRPIKESEVAACKAKGIEYFEMIVANDALSVVINKDNDWVTCLTVDQLKKMWEPAAEGKINNWNQIDPSFPNEALTLFGPGTDSGTFDYFTKEINGEEAASRTDYNPSEDDNVIVSGVNGDKGALGYFGFSYLEENADKIKAVEVDSGSGCVAPSAKAVQDGSYAPLARPLYIYVAKDSAAREEVKAFVRYYFDNQSSITEEALFVGLDEAQKKAEEDNLKVIEGA